MADSKISALAEKTTFGENDFLAGTQGTGATDNRKYGKAAIQDAAATALVWRGIIQSNVASAPTVTVLENTLGVTLNWNRTGVGEITTGSADMPSGATRENTFLLSSSNLDAVGTAQYTSSIRLTPSPRRIDFWVFDAGTPIDSGLHFSVQILYYP